MNMNQLHEKLYFITISSTTKWYLIQFRFTVVLGRMSVALTVTAFSECLPNLSLWELNYCYLCRCVWHRMGRKMPFEVWQHACRLRSAYCSWTLKDSMQARLA